MRTKYIEYILADTEKRGEIITSDIIFLGTLYHLYVKKEGWKRAKKIKYSAGKTILNGYREMPIITN